MNIIMLVISFLMLIASALVAIKGIKEKKAITDPYLIISILTFIIAL